MAAQTDLVKMDRKLPYLSEHGEIAEAIIQDIGGSHNTLFMDEMIVKEEKNPIKRASLIWHKLTE